MTRRVSLAAGALVLALVSGLVLVPMASAQSTVTVIIPNGAGSEASSAPGYVPDTVTVVIGVNNTVTWKSFDQYAHTVTSLSVPPGAQGFNSETLPPGKNFTVTFTVPGTYDYYCTLHSWMSGTVIVKPASTVPAPEFPATLLAVTLFAVIAAVMLAAPRLRPALPSI
jgi:plastocyanin